MVHALTKSMNPLRRPLSLFALFCFLPAFAAAACAIDGPDTLSASPSGPEQTTGASVGAGGNFDPGDMTGGAGGEDSCASTNVEATVKIKPADIIFVIDNSGSMGQEIAGVEKNINVNFAQIIEQSMVDYRVIMLTAHGAHGNDVCIEAPLSTIAQGDCLKTNPAAPGINPGKFYHYDLYVGSHDSLCKILDTVDSPGAAHKDAHGLAPDGWKQWLI